MSGCLLYEQFWEGLALHVLVFSSFFKELPDGGCVKLPEDVVLHIGQ
jgi:hypothetical protein